MHRLILPGIRIAEVYDTTVWIMKYHFNHMQGLDLACFKIIQDMIYQEE